MTNAPGSGKQEAFSPIGNGQLRYLLYLPPSFEDTPEKTWPVLCFLHGIGEAAKKKDGSEQSIQALLDHGAPPWHAEIDSPLIRDFIMLSPQLPERRYWGPNDFEEIIQLLETIYEGFRGDRERTYLTGFSIGGKGVFDFAAWGGKWAALWPVDDANGEARQDCNTPRVWLHFGKWRPDLQRVTAANLKLQETVPFRDANPNQERLYTDYSALGYDHVETCVAAYSDWRVYRWLLSS